MSDFTHQYLHSDEESSARRSSVPPMGPIVDWSADSNFTAPRQSGTGWVTVEETHFVGTPEEVHAKADELFHTKPGSITASINSIFHKPLASSHFLQTSSTGFDSAHSISPRLPGLTYAADVRRSSAPSMSSSLDSFNTVRRTSGFSMGQSRIPDIEEEIQSKIETFRKTRPASLTSGIHSMSQHSSLSPEFSGKASAGFDGMHPNPPLASVATASNDRRNSTPTMVELMNLAADVRRNSGVPIETSFGHADNHSIIGDTLLHAKLPSSLGGSTVDSSSISGRSPRNSSFGFEGLSANGTRSPGLVYASDVRRNSAPTVGDLMDIADDARRHSIVSSQPWDSRQSVSSVSSTRPTSIYGSTGQSHQMQDTLQGGSQSIPVGRTNSISSDRRCSVGGLDVEQDGDAYIAPLQDWSAAPSFAPETRAGWRTVEDTREVHSFLLPPEIAEVVFLDAMQA